MMNHTISSSYSRIHRTFYGFIHDPKYKINTRYPNQDLDILKKGIFVPRIKSCDKQTGLMLVNNVQGQTLNKKYGNNLHTTPHFIQAKFKKIIHLGFNCSLDMTNLNLDDVTEDNKGRLWITSFKNVKFINNNL
jgi:hypothetical protein